jgi:hypothetical protein
MAANEISYAICQRREYLDLTQTYVHSRGTGAHGLYLSLNVLHTTLVESEARVNTQSGA